jgi:hypothetical protein
LAVYKIMFYNEHDLLGEAALWFQTEHAVPSLLLFHA